MSIDTFIARKRAREQQTWRSRGRLTRRSGGSTFDVSTGAETPGASTLIYEGPCQVRASKWVGHDAQMGEREHRRKVLRAKFPANVPAQEDDELELLESDHDADFAGRTFRVTDVLRDDWQIARVCMVEEVVPGVAT